MTQHMTLAILVLVGGCATGTGHGASKRRDHEDSGSSARVDTSGADDTAGAACVHAEPRTLEGIPFVRVCAATFDMGCTPGQSDCERDETEHTVTLTHDFWIGVTEVTQGEFEAVMGYDPSWFYASADDFPVENLSFHEAAAYANALSDGAGLTECYPCSGSGASVACTGAVSPYMCDGYRLPTEAEWEAAARCGDDTPYAGSSNPDEVAWYDDDSGIETNPVARLGANACGTFDMSGNVWEFANDWYGAYDLSASENPEGPSRGTGRILRGGGWLNPAWMATVVNRTAFSPTDRYMVVGFRLARSTP